MGVSAHLIPNIKFLNEEEDQIYNWIITKRENKLPISTKSLCCYAGTIKKEFADKMMNTQLQWAYRFLHRYGFSIRRISHTGLALSENRETIKQKFVEKLIKKRKELNILDDEDFRIINMDETPSYLSMGFETTIDFKDNSNIEIETTGKENYRITSILGVAGDGTKLPPLIILEGESGKSIETKYRKIDYVQNGEVLIYCQKNGWCTNEIFEEWLKKNF